MKKDSSVAGRWKGPFRPSAGNQPHCHDWSFARDEAGDPFRPPGGKEDSPRLAGRFRRAPQAGNRKLRLVGSVYADLGQAIRRAEPVENVPYVLAMCALVALRANPSATTRAAPFAIGESPVEPRRLVSPRALDLLAIATGDS